MRMEPPLATSLEDSPIQPCWAERIAWQSFSYYPRLRRVQEFLAEHPQDRITVSDAARIACCEYKYFSSYFRKKVNVRFTEWVRLVRVAEAARLLRTQDLTICRAARQVGFNDTRAPERAFRHFCSMTPAEYKADGRPDLNR